MFQSTGILILSWFYSVRLINFYLKLLETGSWTLSPRIPYRWKGEWLENPPKIYTFLTNMSWTTNLYTARAKLIFNSKRQKCELPLPIALFIYFIADYYVSIWRVYLVVISIFSAIIIIIYFQFIQEIHQNMNRPWWTTLKPLNLLNLATTGRKLHLLRYILTITNANAQPQPNGSNADTLCANSRRDSCHPDLCRQLEFFYNSYTRSDSWSFYI